MNKIFKNVGLFSLVLYLGIACAKEEPPSEKIYLWTKANDLSPTLKIEHVQALVLSKDGQHLYAYAYGKDSSGNEIPDSGLYYSSNKGSSWTKVKELKAGPKPKNTAGMTDAEIADTKEFKANAPKMTPTMKGLVISDRTKIFILEGKRAIWGIDTSIHYENAKANDKIAVIIKDADIIFANVLKLGAKEKLIFAIERLEDIVWLKNLDDEAPTFMEVKKTDGSPLTAQFTVAGNTPEGNLLLGTMSEIYEIPSANLSIDSPNMGMLSADDPVLKLRKNWVLYVPPIEIGSWLSGKETIYYALTQEGLAFHKGKQGVGEANFSPFEYRQMSIIKNFMGGPLVRGIGIFGLKKNGSLDALRNLIPALILNKKTHMMKKDKSAVNLIGPQISYFTGMSASSDGKKAVVICIDPSSTAWGFAGIYLIEERMGTPRE